MRRSTPLVVYWNNLPAPYMVDRFNALADLASFDFEAWFNDRGTDKRSWTVDESSWRFRYRYLPSMRLFGRRIHWPAPVFGRRPDLVVSLYSEPAFIVGWIILRLRGARTGFRILRTWDRWVARRYWKEALKYLILPRADVIEVPGDDAATYAMKYHVASEKIHYATHTVDLRRYARILDEREYVRQRMRSRLGLMGTVFVYVGRLWQGKGVSYLLEAYSRLEKTSDVVTTLLLVGDGPDEAELRAYAEEAGLKNVVFTGFMDTADVPRVLVASDVLVFPTLGDPYGIVVDEAMACGLPVISTTAAGEIMARIEEGVTGFLVSPENAGELEEAMRVLANDPALCARMGRNAADKVKHNTPDQWARDFCDLVRAALHGSGNGDKVTELSE